MNIAKEDIFDITPEPQEISRSDAIANIFELEKRIKEMPASLTKESPEFKYNHRFVPGIYGREITIPDGTLLTTEIHASENIAVLSKGAVTVYTEKGVEYYEAPFSMVTKIGTKRAMITHGEVIFSTFHHNPTDERDVDKLLKLMTFKDDDAYQVFIENQTKIEEVAQ